MYKKQSTIMRREGRRGKRGKYDGGSRRRVVMGEDGGGRRVKMLRKESKG